MTARARSPLRLGAASVTGLLLVAGITVVLPTPASAATPTVRVFITKTDRVKMPTQLRPGVHRLVVRSRSAGSLQIVRARPGYRKVEAARDITNAFEDNNARAFRRFERNIVLKGGVSSRAGNPGVLWVRLFPGRYWMVDTAARRTLARKILTVRVSGPSVRGRLPGTTIKAVGQVRWSDRPVAIPRSGVLRFHNSAKQSHFVELVRLKPGKTIEDFAAWIEVLMSGQEAPPPVRFRIGTGSGVLDPNRAMSMRYDLPAGDYVLVCFWPDPEKDMLPHAFMGMYRGIRLR